MRILFLANTLPPRDVSGVGEQVLQLAAGLRELGHTVEVLGRGPDGVRGPKLLFPLFAVPATRRALHRLRPDVVQVHESDGALAALLVAACRRRLVPPPLLVALLQVSYVEERLAVRPLVVDGRTVGVPGEVERRFRRFKAPLQIALGRLTARLADLVLAPSAATAAELVRDYRLGRRGGKAVAVVPNATGGLEPSGESAGTSTSTSTAGETAGTSRGTSQGVGETAGTSREGELVETAGTPREGGSAGYLLFVGRLRIRKGVEVLLEALAGRGDEAPRLLIAGDGEHRPALERRAAELGLLGGADGGRAGAVVFLGRCDAARVRELLAGARALVVPSIYEGMPLVVLEAMAAGLPVVASRVSGIPEVVVDGETGWLVPPEDARSLAAAVAAVASDPAEAARRGEAGRRRVAERYRPEVVARLWERAIEEARAQRSEGRP